MLMVSSTLAVLCASIHECVSVSGADGCVQNISSC